MSLRDLAYKIAQEEGINPDLFVRQIEVESAFNPQAKSSAGAMGLAQLMPATAKDLGVTNPYDPEQSLRGGARYMKQLLGRYNNNQTLAHAAYNAGMGNVDKAGGVPNFKETQNYIAKILGGNSMIGAQAPQQMAQQEQPRGLLGGMIDRDFADQLYMAALAGSPNAQRFQPLIQSVQAGRQARREDAKEQKKLELAQKGRNATADYLDSINQSELGNLVRQGAITGANALSAVPKPDKEKTYQYQALAADLLRTGVAKTEVEALQMALSQTKAGTTVHVGPQGQAFGNPPKDTVWKRNPDGTVFIGEDGAPVAIPIAGTKLANEALEKDEKAEVAAEQSLVSGGVVLGNIQEIRQVMENSNLPTTGVWGQILRNIGGTGALDVKKLLDPIEAAIGFERLQAMRDASPTGGALGQVTERELTLLSSALGSLDQAQSKEQFLARLQSIENRYTDIIRKFDAYPPDAMKKAGYQPRLSGGAASVATDDDLLKKYGGQ